MPTREISQFSINELNAFLKLEAPPVTNKEKAMSVFSRIWAASTPESMEPFGGCENIQRVRVVGSPDMPIEAAKEGNFEFVLKLPLAVLEQRRIEAEEKARQAAVIERRAGLMVRVLELMDNPDKMERFVNDLTDAILKRTAKNLVIQAREDWALKAGAKKVAAPKPVKKAPAKLSKAEEFERAVQQDRQQRVTNTKKGPKFLKSEQSKSAAV